MILDLRRRAALAALATLCVWWFGSVAHADAATPAAVRVREASLDPNGSSRVLVSVAGASGVLSASHFRVTEDGLPVDGLTVTPLDRAGGQTVSVALVFDVSGSTAGRPLADAKTAAKAFLAGLPDNVRVALIPFGPRASVRVPFTEDRARLSRAIDSLVAAGGTALYDAVVLGAQALGRVHGQHNMVVFSDGRDTDSRATLAQAVAAAKKAKAPIVAIGLNSRELDPRALGSLASSTGGRSHQVGGSGGLAGVFRDAARELASQYVLSWEHPPALGPRELQISVFATVNGVDVTDSVIAYNPRVDGPAAYARPGDPLIPVFTTDKGLYVGVGGAFLALLLFLSAFLRRPERSEASSTLARGLRLYVKGGSRKKEAESGFSIAKRAAEVVDRVPKSQKYEEKLQASIDRAGWPFRAAEFMALQAAAALGGIAVGGVLLGRWWLALALGVAGPAIPKLLLNRKVHQRQSTFLAQLPDTLQLLAGSLQAGYGFMQAIDTLVKESPAPTSSEFQRVLTETRLGMPVEEALQSMADRLGSEDFRWVVLAINIQRQVGGNLAVLLHTVADTLRERERVRRQIKVLSAEGKLSAWILGALPFAIAGYIAMVNPGFLAIMTGAAIGRVMIAGALVMLGIGIWWMRKIIRIEV